MDAAHLGAVKAPGDRDSPCPGALDLHLVCWLLIFPWLRPQVPVLCIWKS